MKFKFIDIKIYKESPNMRLELGKLIEYSR